ncbi:MAG: sensor histidine kinase [Anaerolineae bacterium]|nr:sensor histidine kinase [Anaerolineae bacterium]
MKHTPLESGVLPVFRLFAALWLVLVLLGGGMLLVWEGFSQGTLLFLLAGIANALLLLGYLLWPRLQRLLGGAYLPVAIAIASIGPTFVNHLLLLLHVHPTEAGTFVDTWPLAAILFVPLVIVAWQHSLRSVIVFCLGTGLLDLALAFVVARGDGMYFFSNAHAIITRTILFFLVGYMVSRIMGIQRQQRQSLAEANTKLTHYATTLEQLATTRERNRLARELHDTLAHTLSAVAVELEAVDSLWEADPTQARALLQRSLAVTRTGLTETRRALQALRSSPLEDLGLALATHQEAQTMAERANLTLDLHIPEPTDNLPPDVEQCVYRVAQEALANAAHHAQAQRVEVSLLRRDSYLALTVSDDGQGFDPSDVDTEHHLGIRGMRERAEMVGGVLGIESEPGQGTTVRLTVEEKA